MRVQVNVSDELVKQIDSYAEKMGVSRSALCSVFIGQGILGYNKSFQMIDNLTEILGKDLLSEKTLGELEDMSK